MLGITQKNQMPILLQSEASECGLCCVAMVAAFYGKAHDVSELRRTMGISLSGANLRSLIYIADTMQMSGRAVKAELFALKNLQLPAILHWNLDHFVVLEKVSSGSITIYDPAVGIRKFSLEEAGNHFTGVALELVPRQDFRKRKGKKKLTLTDFWRDTLGLKGTFSQVFFLSVLVQLFVLALPFYTQITVDEVLTKYDTDLMTVLAICFAGVTIIDVIAKTIRGHANLFLVNQLHFNMGNSVLHHLVRLPMEYFEKRHLGDVVSRFGSIKPIQELLSTGFVSGIIDGILALVTLALMLFYSVKLTAIVLISISIYTIYRLIQFRRFREANHEYIAAEAKLDSIFIETIRGLQGIKLASKEVDREVTWRNQFVRAINTKVKVGRLSIRQDAVETAATGLEYVLTIYIGALIVIQGGMTIGMLFAFLAYRSNFTDATTNIVDLILQYLMVGLHLERISDITSTDKEVASGVHSRMRLPIEGKLQFRNLSYRYSVHDPFVFRNLSGSIEPGEKVALFGPSGSGKTTFMKTLMGLADPSEGELVVDGMPISKLGVECYRHKISSVMQDDGLFSGTLLENITFFEAQVDIDRLKLACSAADILNEIENMPMSFDTLVSDMGSSLSVGQRQRVLIARALYRQPKILFLDEGTAHVGKDSENRIMDFLCEQNFSCVFATHNPKLLRLADKVLIWDLQGNVEIRKRRVVKEAAQNAQPGLIELELRRNRL